MPAFDSEFEKRREAQYRRFGTRTPECAWPGCGETHPDRLTGVHPDIACYEHFLLRVGKRPYELHHLAGQHNSDVTAEVPANDHRSLSERQRLWPEDTLRNPDHSPLLVAAATVRGWVDVLRVLLDHALGWIPDFLEWLNRTLVELHGPDWPDRLGWQPGLRS